MRKLTLAINRVTLSSTGYGPETNKKFLFSLNNKVKGAKIYCIHVYVYVFNLSEVALILDVKTVKHHKCRFDIIQANCIWFLTLGIPELKSGIRSSG